MDWLDLTKIKNIYEIYVRWWTNNEKNIAKNILDKFCSIYSITFIELEEKIKGINKNEEYFEVWKEYNNLIAQIIYKVVWHFNFKMNSTFSKKINYIILECTPEEKEKIKKLIAFYVPIYKNDLQNFLKEREKEFFQAFVYKNQIVPDDKIKNVTDISEDRLLELLEIYQNMEKMWRYNITEDEKILANKS